MHEPTGKEGGLVAALHRMYHDSQTIEKARNIVAAALHLRSVDELQRFEIDGARFSTLARTIHEAVSFHGYER